MPGGVGARGFVRLTASTFRDVMREGAGWCVRHGYGWPEDLERTEGRGCLPGADPEHVSDRAVERGLQQLGTLGSGNHYLEIQVVRPDGHPRPEDRPRRSASTAPGRSSSCCTAARAASATRWGPTISAPSTPPCGATTSRVRDRELACAPFRSHEGQAYFAAMNAAANTAFANRQVITHRVREVMAAVFGKDPHDLGLSVVYDVCHNTAKLEQHRVDGEVLDLVVHRKGATRAFGPGMPDVPAAYREIGQPVIIGGSMETGSALLVGTAHAMAETFGSTAHGAGRTMSRHQAKRQVWGTKLLADMAARGIVVRAASKSGVAEEAGFAYKDLTAVVDVLDRIGISHKVVSFTPIGNIKG